MKRLVVLLASAAAVAAGTGASATRASHVRLAVVPRTGLLDAPLVVRVTGLGARERASIRATERSQRGALWSATVRVRADGRGRVTLRGAPFLWRIRPRRPFERGDAFPRLVRSVTLEVVGHGATARTTFVRRVQGASVRRKELTLSGAGFRGELFAPTVAAKRTGVLFVGGSNGGVPSPLAPALLASHGYPALSVAYFRAPGLPPTLARIPLEYFATALRWLRAQPNVDDVVVLGVSRGAEPALLLGSAYPELVDGVAEYVGAGSVAGSADPAAPAWTRGGQAIPLGPIAVEHIHGPVFAVGGDDDELWLSGIAARAIAIRMRTNGRTDITALVYARAGHALGAIVPNVPTSNFLVVGGTSLRLGDSPAADALARADAWPQLLRFLASV